MVLHVFQMGMIFRVEKEIDISLIGLSTTELEKLCISLGFPKFRGKQIANWIYHRFICDPSDMTDLPASLRERLPDYATGNPQIIAQSDSPDGTTKYLLKLQDNETIECVVLPYEDRISICISSQVGCPLGCKFCATGGSGFSRNLTAGEIVSQYIAASHQFGRKISHIVVMGMGEPLLNLENVLEAIRILDTEVGISPRRITLSTIGIPDKMRELSDHALPITLAISLHAPDQELRARLMPSTAKTPIRSLITACREYFKATGRRITFEYLLIDGINDRPEHASKLINLLKGMPCHVNLIPFNAVPNCDFRKSSKRSITCFRNALENAGISVTQRFEKGAKKDSACGQLRRRMKDSK